MLRVMPQDWEPNDWGEQQASRVAREITRLRGSRSAQWLSDKTDELGHRVSRSVIADMENGRRRYVTTAEIIVLAAALETAPVALLYPGPYPDDESVEYLPGCEISRFDAAQRFSGIFDPGVDKVSEEYWANTFHLRSQRESRDQRRTLAKQIRLSIELGDDDGAKRLMAQLAEMEQQGDGG
jgi:hypothetical protein